MRGRLRSRRRAAPHLYGSAGREGNWAQATELLRESLGLWSGSPLQDVSSERLHTRWVPHLTDLRLFAIESCIDARLNLGEHDMLTGELMELVRQHPLRERFAAQLMLALYRSGRQADALAAYRAARQQLVTEPGAELQTLHERILGGEEPGALFVSAPGQVRHAGTRPVPAQLPADIGDFTGRMGQLDLLDEILSGDGHRAAVTVVAVTGPAGVGKTTLAVHAGHRHRRQFPDGQLFVSLGGACGQQAKSEEVLGRFLRDLGIDWPAVPRDADERAALYRSIMSDRRMLIVLDDACNGAQVRPLIPAGHGNAVLVTSRRRLASLDAARHLDLGVLGVPESRAMFTRVVGGARAGTEPGAVDRVLAVCAGLPLAVRIAAAHLVTQPGRTIGELADRLADTAQRLDVLSAEDRGIRASFQVSYADLAATPPGGSDAVRAFRLLSLWDGPFLSRPAAAALTSHSEHVTGALADALIEANVLESGSPHRYQFHDLMRLYARERAEREETRADRDLAMRQLFSWYLLTADRACRLIEPQRDGPGVPGGGATVLPLAFRSREEAIRWCDSESANLVAAIRQQAQAGHDDHAWRLPAILAPYYNLRKLWADWITTHEIGLASASRASDVLGQPWMFTGLGRAHTDLRQFDEAASSYRQALEMFHQAGDEHGVLWTLIGVAALDGTRGKPEAVITGCREALRMCVELGDEQARAVALGNLACALVETGRHDEAIASFRQALAIRSNRGDLYGQGLIHHNIGETYRMLGRDAEAAGHLSQALEIRREVGDRYGEALTLGQLGELFFAQQPAQARDYLAAKLRILQDLGTSGATGTDSPQAAKFRAMLAAPG
jgi:tetratricopeptide (TPR) repeat protein